MINEISVAVKRMLANKTGKYFAPKCCFSSILKLEFASDILQIYIIIIQKFDVRRMYRGNSFGSKCQYTIYTLLGIYRVIRKLIKFKLAANFIYNGNFITVMGLSVSLCCN